MSTVPTLLDQETPVRGPVCEIGAPLEIVVEELVAAKRDLEKIRADRERAAQLLGDVDGTLTRAQARVDAAQQSFDAYVTARVSGPLP